MVYFANRTSHKRFARAVRGLKLLPAKCTSVGARRLFFLRLILCKKKLKVEERRSTSTRAFGGQRSALSGSEQTLYSGSSRHLIDL